MSYSKPNAETGVCQLILNNFEQFTENRKKLLQMHLYLTHDGWAYLFHDGKYLFRVSADSRPSSVSNQQTLPLRFGHYTAF